MTGVRYRGGFGGGGGRERKEFVGAHILLVIVIAY